MNTRMAPAPSLSPLALRTGGPGDDTLRGTGADDTLDGAAGDDFLHGDAGSDSLLGGDGDDTLYGGDGYAVHETPGDGGDTLRGGAGDDVLYGDAGNDVMAGGDGIDNLFGDGGNDRLDGGESYDYLIYHFGDGGHFAGNGNRAVRFDASALVGPGEAVIAGGFGGEDTLSGFEVLVVRDSAGADTITGSQINDYVYAFYGGDDWVRTGLGDDLLYGGPGNDSLNGGEGQDILDFRYETGGSGVMVDLQAGTAVHVLGTDTLLALEHVFGSDFDDHLMGDAQSNSLEGRGGGDSLSGVAGDDVLYGAEGADLLQGGAGRDALEGGSGHDTLIGGGAAGDDRISGGDGIDTADYGLADRAVRIDLNNSWAGKGTDRFSGVENLAGSAFDDELGGSSLGNLLVGGSGDDHLQGRAGDDTLRGGAGSDTLTGGSGADVLALNSLVDADTFLDFVSGSDTVRIQPRAFGLPAGPGAPAQHVGPGGFDPQAGLVIITGDIDGAPSATSAAARIGAATSAYAVGERCLFVVDNGDDSSLYLFTAATADATIDAAELTLLAGLVGTGSTALADWVVA